MYYTLGAKVDTLSEADLMNELEKLAVVQTRTEMLAVDRHPRLIMNPVQQSTLVLGNIADKSSDSPVNNLYHESPDRITMEYQTHQRARVPEAESSRCREFQRSKFPEDRVPEDQVPEDRVLEHRVPKDRVPEDRVPEDRDTEERVPEEPFSNHHVLKTKSLKTMFLKSQPMMTKFPTLTDRTINTITKQCYTDKTLANQRRLMTAITSMSMNSARMGLPQELT